MRIAQLAPISESVPPARYGGTERVVATLTEELVRRNHQVTLFASGDSDTSAHLVPVVDQAVWHRPPPYADPALLLGVALGKVARAIHHFDIVHNHVGYLAYPLARLAPCPVVTTLHGRLDLPELAPLYREFTDVPLVSISSAQRIPEPGAYWVATIPHGIDLSQYTFNPRPDAYLAFLGRISPEKGLDTAIRVARRAGLPLKIAARMPLLDRQEPEVRKDWEYYEQVVQPLLDEPGIEMVGEVGGKDKDAFLGNAAALLFPIRWPEPFGLVMPEALACGTPVVALRAGSVLEVVEDGVSGFICQSEDELVEAIARIPQLERARCRIEAERRFCSQVMTDRYEEVYTRLVGASHATAAIAKNGAVVRQVAHFNRAANAANQDATAGLSASTSVS
jgi:glycosyltransferase involved in cell wall biosynthesis